MKTRQFTLLVGMSILAALAMPICMAAQDNLSPDHKSKHKKYRLIDLGTFGGPWSAVSFTEATVNNAGVAVGGSSTTIPNPNGNPWNCGGPLTVRGFEARGGRAIELEGLAGEDRCTAPQLIIAQGDIVGDAEIDTLDPLFGFHEMRAVRWRNGRIQNLGTLGGRESTAQSTNSRGQVTGFSLNSTPDPYSFFDFLAGGSSDGTQTRAFIWQNGSMHDLGTLGGPDANAWDMNDRGQITGLSYTNSIPNPTTGFPTIDPFVWDQGRMIDLGTLGGTVGSPVHINKRGQVIGTSNLAGDEIFHPFLWDRGVLTDLGTFGGSTGTPNWITDSGDVIGVADFPGDVLHDGFLWERGVMTDLGNLGRTSNAHGLNSGRQIVGGSKIDDIPNNIRAFLWENGGPMVDLNTLIPRNSSLTLVVGWAINDQGVIAGTGVPVGCAPSDVDACGHAFLLIPNGDCDGDCQNGVDQSYAEAELRRQTAAAITQRAETPPTPIERMRSMMQQRYHLPSQPVVRD